MKTFSKPLTREEEAYYLHQLKYGDAWASKQAADILVERNMRLVAHVLKKYQNVQEDMEDLLSCGTIGLIKAIKSYEPEKGSKLATYAGRCIENEILMLLRGHKKITKEISLFEPIGTDKEGNEVRLLDVLEYEQADTVEKLQKWEDIEKLNHLFETVLTDREKEIVSYRYGMQTGEEMTQREIGQKLGISRSYVSRIEKKALGKLQKGMK